MVISQLAILGQFTIWLTPIWLLAVGATLGLLVLSAVYGMVWLISRQRAESLRLTVAEGVLQPVLFVGMLMAGFAVLAAQSMPVTQMWNSVTRVTAVGPGRAEETVPQEVSDHPVEVVFRARELKDINISSDQDVFLTVEPGGMDSGKALSVEAHEPSIWKESVSRDHIFSGTVSKVYITNESSTPAHVVIQWTTGVEYPEVAIVPKTALALIGLLMVYFLMQWAMPKVSAIALATSKEAIAQSLFAVTLALGVCALVAFIYVPYNTFGEDIKMLKDSGLTLIKVLAVIVALWTASVSIAEEIEGRTALTVLSKPIGRRQFILGKFLGIIWPIVLMFLLLGLVFLVTVSFKVAYDARETAAGQPIWQECFSEMISVIPGLVLAFFEAVMLAAISVAISTRLPMLPNLVICSSIYVLGHLGPLIVNSSVGEFPMVRFMGQLIAIMLPNLDVMDTQAAVAGGQLVPLVYLAWALVYCALYSTVAVLLALALFEDRDLA